MAKKRQFNVYLDPSWDDKRRLDVLLAALRQERGDSALNYTDLVHAALLALEARLQPVATPELRALMPEPKKKS